MTKNKQVLEDAISVRKHLMVTRAILAFIAGYSDFRFTSGTSLWICSMTNIIYGTML